MKRKNYRTSIIILILISIFGLTSVWAKQQPTVRESSSNVEIDFRVIEMSDDFGYTHWNNVVLGPDGNYYFAIGDHFERVLLISYDPETRKEKICLDSRNISGLKDGKWHGRPDINPENGDMYLVGFDNGDLVYYNIYSGNYENIGQPLPGTGFQEHIWDWERERLYGIGIRGELLVYDTKNRKLLFSEVPSGAMELDARSRVLDRETGKLYSSDGEWGDIYEYDPATNSVSRLLSTIGSAIRASTYSKDETGAFWVLGRNGDIYKFWPEQDKVEYQGTNYEDGGEYCSFIERSPGGRYLYYHTAQQTRGLAQYDTQTGSIKILAALDNLSYNGIEYALAGSYGGALSADGSVIFLACNGVWGAYERPGMIYVSIPESERAGDPVMDVPEQNNHSISDFALLQNFPNPFNPTTTVSYSLQEKSPVAISIFNLNGEFVETLTKGIQDAGIHSVVWNASAQPSGAYFIRLIAGDLQMTKKCLFIK